MKTVLGFAAYALRTIGWDVVIDYHAHTLEVVDNHGKKWQLAVKQI